MNGGGVDGSAPPPWRARRATEKPARGALRGNSGHRPPKTRTTWTHNQVRHYTAAREPADRRAAGRRGGAPPLSDRHRKRRVEKREVKGPRHGVSYYALHDECSRWRRAPPLHPRRAPSGPSAHWDGWRSPPPNSRRNPQGIETQRDSHRVYGQPRRSPGNCRL